MDNVGRAVDQLIEAVDNHNYKSAVWNPNADFSLSKFRIDHMEIVKDKDNEGGWIVRAIDHNDRSFMYVNLVTVRGDIIMDGE